MPAASRIGHWVAIGFAWFAFSASARADEIADFYKGKTLTFIIAFNPGGAYDLYARLAARHLGRHLPGNPQIVPQTMPLACGLRAANFLYEVAPRDGTVVGLIAHNVMEQQVVGAEGIAYQADRFNWIGRMNVINEAEVVWLASGAVTIEDAFRKEIVLGASGPTATPTVYPRVLNAIAGTRFKIVTGYSGAPESCLAMERGEVQGCLLDYANIKTTKRAWLEGRKIGVLFQMAATPDPMFPGVRHYASFGKTEEDRQALAVYAVSAEVGRAVMAPPGIPEARVAALRAAFDSMLKDIEFLADAARASLEINGATGAELQKMIERAAAIPPAAIARARAAREAR